MGKITWQRRLALCILKVQMHGIEKGNNRCISLTGMIMKKE